MAKSKDRGVYQRKDRPGWWLRIYLNGRPRSFRCDSKRQAVALRGRLKAEAREGKYFEKPKAVPFRELATDYMTVVDARRRRNGEVECRDRTCDS
jgi:hypothetical protein